jgi:hypothetical protein
MGKNINRFDKLFEKYIHRNYTADERNEFLDMVAHEDYNSHLKELISEEVKANVPGHIMDEDKADEIFDKIVKTANEEDIISEHSIKKSNHLRWWAAAVVIFAVAGGYFLFHSPTSPALAQKVSVKKDTAVAHDVAPGHSGAILTLANGEKVVLDSLHNGLLASQGTVKIIKQGNNVSYQYGNKSSGEILYNTMTTPNGRQYQLELSDGTKVWLDAGSSITYPASFVGNERKVEITGEVYFEVKTLFIPTKSGNEKMPFTVLINPRSKLKREIQVLGTHFNINAYSNEASAKITLLEGSVKVFNENSSVIIQPGEQAVLDNEANKMSVVNADVNEAVAWKDGFFSFNNADIETIMRQVERWYDVQVVYEGEKPKDRYGGEVSKNVNASDMLKILEVSGVHFQIEGKKIIIRSR